MRLPLLTEKIDRKLVANSRVGDGIFSRGSNPFTCACGVLSCAATCIPDPALYGLCKTCF